VNWLQTIADEDKIDLEAAAVQFVVSGATLSATEWANLDPEGRSSILIAQKAVRVQSLSSSGRDMDAALETASLDGGRQVARRMATAAAHGVANALRAKQVP
jgi:hypothetical protein